ncbi:Uncharacterized protein HA466_0032190 [Hirschfeldia incana]|nr:Uncharacterized protein HA466_0032190 [Hirschfeldia incana]KAJ0262724.1 Uncharacterized protein HA466_0032190 [Hirschfeldia incana]
MEEGEARRALDVAEKKLLEKDYKGAKKFLSKAQRLYPNLDGLVQVSTMIDVYANGGGVESDLYGILGVDPFADDVALKKQYKKLALLLHPDKNMFNGAEDAFKLVLDAWSLLSDKSKRVAYDHQKKRKREEDSTEKKSEPEPAPAPAPAAARENHHPPRRPVRRYKLKTERRARQEEAGKAKEEEKASSPSPKKEEKVISSTFWTMCTHCLAYSEHVRAAHLDKTLPCPYCHGLFLATESFTEMVNGKPFIRFAPPPPPPQATCASTSDEPMATEAIFKKRKF